MHTMIPSALHLNKLKENCGILGVFLSAPSDRIGEFLFYGLFALQHRGQEAAGYAITDGKSFHFYKDLGMIEDVFKNGGIFDKKGFAGIAHNRYSTSGAKAKRENAQPLFMKFKGRRAFLVHNGNLVNSRELRRELEGEGFKFSSDSDSELLLALYLLGDNPKEGAENIFKKARGAYSVVILEEEKIVALRDPYGFRPLVLGRKDDAIFIASETASFHLLGASYLGEVEPGELVVIEDGIRRERLRRVRRERRCIFELIYFSRPDSRVFGLNSYVFRKRCGEILAEKEMREMDVVIPVPDSGVPAAIGYSLKSRIPLELGLIRSHYTGRSFIEPTDERRKLRVRLKLLPIRDVIEGRRIALIDDSIVRGTTSRAIVKYLRDLGAREVHLRVASPPLVGPCFFGIDIPTREELVAGERTIEEIADFIGVDSLRYLEVDDLFRAAQNENFCVSCFTLDYEF